MNLRNVWTKIRQELAYCAHYAAVTVKLGFVAGIGLIFGICPMARAQTPQPAYTGQSYVSLSAVSTPGAGAVFSIRPVTYNYTWTVSTTGTVTAAVVNLEGSLDNVTWFEVDQAGSTDANWSAGEMRHVVNKSLNFVRCRLVSISGGGAVTATFAIYQ